MPRRGRHLKVRTELTASAATSKARIELTLRVLLGDLIAMGPGKAQLLEAIASTGSIAAAARQMGMSYRRAWLLVDAMNRCFRLAVVSSSVGGVEGGGAQLTEFGREVVARFRELETVLDAAVAPKLKAFEHLLATHIRPG